MWGMTIPAELIEDIRKDSYTYILISPELLISDKLHEFLVDPMFRYHVALVVVDEDKEVLTTHAEGRKLVHLS